MKKNKEKWSGRKIRYARNLAKLFSAITYFKNGLNWSLTLVEQ